MQKHLKTVGKHIFVQLLPQQNKRLLLSQQNKRLLWIRNKYKKTMIGGKFATPPPPKIEWNNSIKYYIVVDDTVI